MGKKAISLKIEVTTKEAEYILQQLKASSANINSDLIGVLEDFSSFEGTYQITLIRKGD